MNQRVQSRGKLLSPGGEDSALGAPGGGGSRPLLAARSPLTPALSPQGRGRKWRRYAIYAFAGLMAIVCVAIGALWGLIDSFGPAPLGRDLEMSKTVLDRNGRLLRSYVTSQGRWRLPATQRASRSALFRRALRL